MKISILGTGAYGIALATTLYSNKHEISMWTKYQEEVDTLLVTRENKKLLPGIYLDKAIDITSDLESCLIDSMVIIIAVPMNAVREVAKQLTRYISNEQIVCIVTKGIEVNSGKRMSEILKEETNSENICMVSGPSFAIDLASGNQLGLVAASKNIELCKTLKEVFENDNITMSITEDVTGIEICASAKNAFAIIMGMLEGSSESTRATMLTILLNDLRLTCEVLGGRPTSVFTYAGIGDFLLTCMNAKSRNYTFGSLIAKGKTTEEAFETMGITTVEGIYSLKSIHQLLHDRIIDVQSIDTLYNIIYNNGPRRYTEMYKITGGNIVKLHVNEDLLNSIKENALQNHVPILQDESLKLIEVMLQMTKPKKVLEIGTAVGYSAAVFAKHLVVDESDKSGSYIKTIERNENRYKEATENITKLELNDYIIPVFADATEYLTNLEEDNTYDIVFIDAAKGQYLVFLNEAKRLVKPGGVIIADNVLFKGRVLGGYNEHRHRTAVNRLREYIDDINEDKTLSSVVLNVGDGVAISIVNK